jgi:hypothetical protein
MFPLEVMFKAAKYWFDQLLAHAELKSAST